MQVKDVMTEGVIGVGADATLAEAVDKLLSARVSALLVFDRNNALVGILSEGDLLRRSELGTDKRRPRWIEFLLSGGKLAESYAHTHGRRVGEIMTDRVVSIRDDADVREAVDLMIRRNVKRLPVLHGESVVGVISRSDLLKGLAKAMPRPGAKPADDEIRQAIEAEFDRLGWAPRASVRVAVKDGVVTLTGAITDERLRGGLKVIAENAAGVSEVRDRVAWIEPNSGAYLSAEDDAKP